MDQKNNGAAILVESKLCDLNWIRLDDPPVPPLGAPLTVVDLFCGCGGLSLGAREAAHSHGRPLEVGLAVDLFDSAMDVFRANFTEDPEVARLQDIQEVFPGDLGAPLEAVERDLRKTVTRPHVIMAGPPCQGHSDLNNHTRRNDPRNMLYLKVVRAVEVLRPKAVIIENVPTVIHDQNGVTLESRQFFESQNYDVVDFTLKAQNIGLAQKRTRHFLLATSAGGPFNVDAFMKAIDASVKTVRDYIADIEDENQNRDGLYYKPAGMMSQNRERVKFLFDNNCYDLPNEHRPKCHRDKSHSYVSMYGRMHYDKPAQTITSGFGSMGQGRFVHPSRRRTITPHEAARLQGFPDFFDFSPVIRRTHLQEVIGNAVPPRIGALLVNHLLNYHL